MFLPESEISPDVAGELLSNRFLSKRLGNKEGESLKFRVFIIMFCFPMEFNN
jgi:hypothetical protein